MSARESETRSLALTRRALRLPARSLPRSPTCVSHRDTNGSKSTGESTERPRSPASGMSRWPKDGTSTASTLRALRIQARRSRVSRRRRGEPSGACEGRKHRTLRRARPSPSLLPCSVLPRLLLAHLPLPEPGVLREDRERRQPAEDDSPSPLANASLEEVHAKESQPGAEEEPARRSTHAVTAKLLRGRDRVAVPFLEVAVEVVVGLVEQLRAKRARIPTQLDLLVNEDGRVPSLGAVEEPEHLVPLPARRADRAAVEMILPADPVPIPPPGVGKNPLDLRAKRLGDALVRIQDQDPAVCQRLQRPVLLRGGILVLVLEHPVRDRAGDLERAVRASGIHDDQLLRPAERLQAAADRARLILRGHERAQVLEAHAGAPARSARRTSQAWTTCSTVTSRMQRMKRSPGSGHRVSLQWRHGSPSASTAACGPVGGCHAPGFVGPKRVTVGIPSATARCLGPE